MLPQYSLDFLVQISNWFVIKFLNLQRIFASVAYVDSGSSSLFIMRIIILQVLSQMAAHY